MKGETTSKSGPRVRGVFMRSKSAKSNCFFFVTALISIFIAVALPDITLGRIAIKDAAAGPRAKRGGSNKSAKVVKVIDITGRFTPPTFRKVRPVQLMDGGRLLYYGRGALTEQNNFFFLDIAANKKLSVTAPIEAYVSANPDLFAGFSSVGKLPPYHVDGLLSYDTSAGEGYVLAWDRRDNPQHRRRFLIFRWDLKKNVITSVTVADRMSAGKEWITLKPIGYNPSLKTVYFYINTKRTGTPKASTYYHQVVALSGKSSRTVAGFDSPRHVSAEPFYDSLGNRVLLAEYSELAEPKPPAKGRLIHLGTGKTLSFDIPETTYGAEFSEDGRIIYLFSAENGIIRALDAANGKKIKDVKVGKLGFGFGLLGRSTLCLIRHAGIQVYSLPELKLLQSVPMKRIFKGHAHIQGSAVGTGKVFVVNRDTLYIVDMGVQ